MRSWLALCAVGVALGACGPKTIWTGHTADRLHTVDVVRDSGYDYVVVDGQRRAAYRGVAGWSIALAGEHLAFAAKIGGDWVVVRDGRVMSDRWDAIGDLRITASGLLVYVAQRDRFWHVMTCSTRCADDKPGPPVDAVLADTLRIAGSHIAYVAQRGARVHAIVDGRVGAAFDGIGQLTLTADGHSAYAVRLALSAHVVVDDTVGERCDAVEQLQLGPGGHVAYVALLGDERHLVHDRSLGPAVDSVSHIAFRDDGAHVAWVGRVGGSDVLMLDDAPLGTWAHRRDAKLAFRPTTAGKAGVGLAFARTTDQGDQMVVDDVAGPLFDEVRAPVWSRDGELAYAARRGTTWLIVHGDREIPAGDTVSDPVMAGPRLAYVARRGKASIVVVDGREYSFGLVFEDSIAFSSDGARWGVIAGDPIKEQLFIVIDGTRRIPLAVRELYSAAASGAGGSTLRDWTQAELDKPAR